MARRTVRTIAIAAVLVALPRLGVAQRVSDGADIAERGTLEVETDYAQTWSDSAIASSGAALLKYSLSDSLQLQLGTDSLITVQSGAATQMLDGVYLGPKLVLRDQSELAPSISVSAMMSLPTRGGDDALTRTVDAYLCAYASKDVLGVHADVNLGANVLSIDAAPATQLVAAAAVSREVLPDLGAALETYMFQGGGDHADHDAGALFALSYTPAPWIKIEAGGDVALYRDARSLTVFTAVTVVPVRRAHPAERPALASR
jgi:hypothetical protein